MKLGLLAKMILFILVPAVLGLMLLAGVSYKMSEKILREQIETDMKIVLQTQASGIHAVLMGLKDSLGIVAQNNRITQYINRYSTGEAEALSSPQALAADTALQEFTDVSDNISYSALIALDGKVIAHHVSGQTGPSKSVGTDFSQRSYFIEALKGKTSIVDVISATTGQPTTVIAVPVERNKKIVAVISVGISNSNLADDTTNLVKVGEKGFAFIYDMAGKMVMHPDPKALTRQDGNKPHVREMMTAKHGRVDYADNKGEAKFIYFQELPEENWIIGLELDRSEILAPVHRMFTNALLVAAVCVLIVGFMIIFSARGIAHMVRGFSNMANAVAGGRLETDPAETRLLSQAQNRRDEFSVLGQGMGHMMGNIKTLLEESDQKTLAAEQATEAAHQATLRAEEAAHQAENAKREGMLAAAGQLEGVVSIISSASSQLSAQIEQSDRGAVESAQRLGEAATAMNEMNATVQEVARNASSAASVSTETRANAEDGAKIVQSALKSIDQVHKVSLELKTDMSKLNDHAQAINRIMNVISDIADQTNLLALNAAIEAARAGDAGRGFAVVADEVRKLAEKTMASTNDVGSAISSIQESASQSVAAMDKALHEVETATLFASQSGDALRQIVTNVEATADQVGAIATASEEQSAASEEINQSISQVNDMVTQSAQAMGEAAQAVTELARQAQTLNQLIAEMKRG
ncbi:MAG: methyl-accepting chemotaxis protein [Desulfovibrio sp.]|uniref:methyl-accepting chemotaxis protein n=1 Tax=Desulfovibrio sp. TaxID=885 RepID=UPI0039E68244